MIPRMLVAAGVVLLLAPRSARGQGHLICSIGLRSTCSESVNGIPRWDETTNSRVCLDYCNNDSNCTTPGFICPGNRLVSLEHRARQLRGQLDIQSVPNHGTTVLLRVPV